MLFVMSYDGWEELNFHGRRWLWKRTDDGLLIYKRIAGHGIDRTVCLNSDVTEAELFYALSEK